jgi:phage head maturation protease
MNKGTYYSVKPCNIKASIINVDTVGRTVTGFYNAFNFVDSDGDVLIPGSAKKSIKERGPASNAVAKIKHALHHDLTQLPGKIVTLDERSIGGISGIYFETKMADTTIGNDTLKNYLEGIYDNHSIGFQYVQVEYIEKGAKNWDKYVSMLINPQDVEDELQIVKEILLYEGSTVAFGANSLTPFLGVKSRNKEAMKIALIERLSKLETTLKTGTQSDEMMKTFEIQVLQLKEMVAELTDNMTFGKITPIASEPIPTKSIDLDYISRNFKL